MTRPSRTCTGRQSCGCDAARAAAGYMKYYPSQISPKFTAKVSLFFSVLLFFRKSPTTGSFDCWASCTLLLPSVLVSDLYIFVCYIFFNFGIFSGMYVEALTWLTSLTCFRYSLSTKLKWIPRNQEPIRVMGSWRIPSISLSSNFI